jgi:hypothetical protein
MKRTIIFALIWLFFGSISLLIAKSDLTPIWTDVLLFVSGVAIGCFCAELILINILIYKKAKWQQGRKLVKDIRGK